MLSHDRNGARMPAAASIPGPSRQPHEVAVRIELAQSIPGHDREINVVELRSPTFGDWISCGDIHSTVIFDPKNMQAGVAGAVRVDVNPEAVEKWFARLSGLSSASLVKLSMADARTILREVVKLVGSLDAGN